MSEDYEEYEDVKRRREMWIGESGNAEGGHNMVTENNSLRSRARETEKQDSRTKEQEDEMKAQAEVEEKGDNDNVISLDELYLFKKFKEFLTKGKQIEQNIKWDEIPKEKFIKAMYILADGGNVKKHEVEKQKEGKGDEAQGGHTSKGIEEHDQGNKGEGHNEDYGEKRTSQDRDLHLHTNMELEKQAEEGREKLRKQGETVMQGEVIICNNQTGQAGLEETKQEYFVELPEDSEEDMDEDIGKQKLEENQKRGMELAIRWNQMMKELVAEGFPARKSNPDYQEGWGGGPNHAPP
ncbi:hypothetical protein PIB30_074725 [Stylosanthes scabra]|uniref:Uncharacterized protein n=1 Tax=Stylosanthes scabra TaxID=79078 RepID=A0ABU6VQU7_9FABA|nr:hypothetical protein [Stylosanthes scabra]